MLDGVPGGMSRCRIEWLFVLRCEGGVGLRRSVVGDLL